MQQKNEGNKQLLAGVFYNKILLYLEKIYEHLEKIDISYKVISHKDGEEHLKNVEYPYKNFWIEYIKNTKKFFKKIEGLNNLSVIESNTNSSNKINDFKILNNELAIMFEENNFIDSLLLIMVNTIFINNYKDR